MNKSFECRTDGRRRGLYPVAGTDTTHTGSCRNSLKWALLLIPDETALPYSLIRPASLIHGKSGRSMTHAWSVRFLQDKIRRAERPERSR